MSLFSRKSVATLTKPEIRTLKAQDFSVTTYADLTAELGINCPELASEKLIQTLCSLNLPIFDYEQVVSYMDKTALAAKLVWHWAPLRHVDLTAPIIAGPGYSAKLGGTRGSNRHSGGRGQRVPLYTRAVPFHVLQQVKAIITKHEEPLHFFATDYQVANPDPFMAVTDQFCFKLFVFAVWDEPGFDDKYARI